MNNCSFDKCINQAYENEKNCCSCHVYCLKHLQTELPKQFKLKLFSKEIAQCLKCNKELLFLCPNRIFMNL